MKNFFRKIGKGIKKFWQLIVGAVVVTTILAAPNDPQEIIIDPNAEPLPVSATCTTDPAIIVNGKYQFRFECVTSDNRSFKSAVYFTDTPTPEELVTAETQQANNWVNVVVDQSNNDTPPDEIIE